MQLFGFLLASALGVVLVTGGAGAQASDSDGDGLTDDQELAAGMDPHWIDSDMDGIADPDESDTSTAARSAVSGDPTDVDDDDIPNLLETYGFYVDGTDVLPAGRIVSHGQWSAFESRDPIVIAGTAYDVYSLAAKALVDNGLRLDGSDDSYRVYPANAAEVIRAEYLAAGIPATHQLITGATNYVGSVNNIIYQFLGSNPETGADSYPVEQPVGADGGELPVLYTMPTRWSTDLDPYSDGDEARGVFADGAPEAPTDHPLIAAKPTLRTTLVDYELVPQVETRVLRGELTGTESGVVEGSSRAEAVGFTVTRGMEMSISLAGPEASGTLEFGLSNEISFSSSKDYEHHNSHDVYEESEQAVKASCFAKFEPRFVLRNVGSTVISDAATTLNIYFGNDLWQTIQPAEGLNLTLGRGQHYDFAVELEGEKGCVTVEQANYLARGGLVLAEQITSDGTVTYADPNGGLVQGGSWAVYGALIENSLARVSIDALRADDEEVAASFWVTAQDAAYPKAALSVDDVLKLAYPEIPCDQDAPATRCFEAGTSSFDLADETPIVLQFEDADGEVIESEDYYRDFLAEAGAFGAVLPKRAFVSIVDDDFDDPRLTDVRVLVESDGTSVTDSAVSVFVRDTFGISEVEFCKSDGDCEPMIRKDVMDFPGSVFNALYEIGPDSDYLKNYTFVGTDKIKAKNILGNSSEVSLDTTFFQENRYAWDRLERLEDVVASNDANIAQIEIFERDELDRYERVTKDGLLLSIGDAVAANNALRLALDDPADDESDATAVCDSDEASASESMAGVLARFTECNSKVDSVEVTAENTEGIYNPWTLPTTRLYARFVNPDVDSEFGPGWDNICYVGEMNFITGVAMTKTNGEYITWIKYVTWDEDAGTLSGEKETRCGSSQDKEKQVSAPLIQGVTKSHRANIILNVGASVQDNNIQKICVSYRTFNFLSGEYEGYTTAKCSDGGSAAGLEETTGAIPVFGGTILAPRSLRAIYIEGGGNTINRMAGVHRDLIRDFEPRAADELVPGGEYYITHGDRALTLGSPTSGGVRVVAARFARGEDQVWVAEAVNDREFRLVPRDHSLAGGLGGHLRPDENAGVVVANAASPVTGPDLNESWEPEQFRVELLLPYNTNDASIQDYAIRSVPDRTSALTFSEGGISFSPWSNSTGQAWSFVPANSKHHPLFEPFTTSIDSTVSGRCTSHPMNFDEIYVGSATMVWVQSGPTTVNRAFYINAATSGHHLYDEVGFIGSKNFNFDPPTLLEEPGGLRICNNTADSSGYTGVLLTGIRSIE